ncbi:hypothetical protein K1719_015465 [Acacia pycnantha]|nr:hypothetical protein K1719_015465 [Acacia pycnantha]
MHVAASSVSKFYSNSFIGTHLFLFQVPLPSQSLAMAYSTRTCFLFIVVLVLSHELVFIEGRNLRQNINHHFPNSAIDTTKSNIASPSLFDRPIRNLEEHIDAFRPTTPGHSPGVGHSIHN